MSDCKCFNYIGLECLWGEVRDACLGVIQKDFSETPILLNKT
jgi:hypothetical protein